MATPQEARPDASSELPGDSSDLAGNTAQPQAIAGAPSTEAIKADPPLGEASSHDMAARAAPIEMVADAASEVAAEPVAAGGAAAPARSSRFALLAASLALAAGLGGVVGSLSASGLAHLSPVAAAAPKSGRAKRKCGQRRM